ncbi:MAG: choice-of-anchor L domain-containing protein [Lewinellaceae bacterium]|nr:choice-of-anchor L domain-containing protein [Lewinellaceae bacterium]
MKAKSLLLPLFLIPSLFGFSEIPATPSGGDIQIINLEGNAGRDVIYIQDALTEVQICQLKPGETYNIQAVQMAGCQPLLELPGTGKSPQSAINFMAGASCQTVFVHTDYPAKGCSGAMYLTTVCATCNAPSDKGVAGLRGSLTVIPAMIPQTLVQDIFIGGGCFEISNVTYKGAALAEGSFSGGDNSVGIPNGVILSSGPVTAAIGPNNQTGAGGAVGGGSDIDLVAAMGQGSGGVIKDACKLEFDFVPTVSQITFRYVFASEEYCDYVNSTFNDVFGFFISGPGISGPYSNNAMNIAVLPGAGVGGTPVSINNVNHITNSNYYVGNIPAGDPQLSNPNCQGHPIAGPPATLACQYDGFTKVLTAVANVIPCETYHIKLAVGDATDDAFDSAVFLGANSFNLGGNAEVVATVPPVMGTVAYEGCNNGYFTFTRGSGDPTVPLVINYTISGTATPGQDYAPIPLSVTIPANQSFVQVPVTIFDDIISEGTETIIITLENPCNCTTSTAIMEIVDPTPVNVDIDIDPICKGNPFSIIPTITGGAPPYQYAWSPSGSGAIYNGIANQPGVYTVTVTDYCGSVDTDTANLEVYTLKATISGSTTVCPGSPGTLSVSFTGIGPWSFTYQVSGGGPVTISGITQNPYQLAAPVPGTYTITSVSNGSCTGPGAGQGVATIPIINLSTQVTNVACYGGSTGAIDLTVSGGTSPYTYAWNYNSTSQDLQNIPAGFYVVNVIDNRGCNMVTSAQVTQPPALTAAATALSGVNCDNPEGGSINLDVAGGSPGYTFLWNTGSTSEDPSGLTAGTYIVTVTDSHNCTATDTVAILGDSSIPIAEFQVTGAINCSNNVLTLDAGTSSGGPNYTYEWIASGGGTITGDANAVITTAEGAGTYELIVSDTLNDCFTSASMIVQSDFDTPLADAGPGQTINCLVNEVGLNGTASSAGPGIAYSWTTAGGNFTSPTNTPTPTVDAPGDYQLVVTNTANGCADTSLVSVVADLTDPLADAGQDGIIDCDFLTFQITGAGSSAGPEFTYLWTTPDGNIVDDPTTLNPTVDQAGTYILLVTDTSNGCTAMDEASVTDLSTDPVIQIETPEVLTCSQPEISLDASGSDSGAGIVFSWASPSGGTILSGSDTPTPVVGAAGTYELTLTNTLTGCQSVATVDVTDDLIQPLADAGMPLTISCSLPDLQLDGTGSASGPGYSYSWTSVNGGNIVSGANTTTPIINNSGSYILTVTDLTNGCSAADTVEVALDTDAPAAVASTPQILDCTHPEVLVSGIGSSLGPNFNYEWTTTDGNMVMGTQTLFLTVDEPGTYTLTVTNSLNSCSSETSVVLGIDTLAPAAAVAPPQTLTCAVSSVQLDGSNSSQGAGYSYLWTTTGGSIIGDSTVLNPEVDQPGVYQLLVTNTGNGCTSETGVEVFQDLVPPAADAGNTAELNCGISSVVLDGAGSAAGPGYSYSWTTSDGNIVLGNTTLSPVVDQPGVYQITVLNGGNGCTASDQVIITENLSPPQAVIGAPGTLTCTATSLTLDGDASAGSGNLTYTWSTLDGNIAGPVDMPMSTIDQPGDYQLIVVQTDNLCSDTALVTVSQNIALPMAEAGPTQELDCDVTSLSLDGTGSSAGAVFSYAWTTSNGIILSGGNTLNPTINAAGTYELTVLDNSNGCSTTDQVVITQDINTPVANAGATQQLNCLVSSLVLDGNGSSQGAGFNYQWTTADGNLLSGDTGLSPLVDAPGTYVLTVVNTQNNCQSSSAVTITQDIALPTAEAGAAAVLTCSAPTASLNAGASSQGANFTYSWTTGNGNIVSGATTLTPQVDQSGTYTLLVTNSANGCTSTDATTVSIDQVPPSVVLQTPGPLTCVSPSLSLGASGTSTGPNFSYLWTTSDGQITGGATTLSPTIDQPGTYTLTVTNGQNGCTASEAVTVAQSDTPPDAVAGPAGQLNCTVSTLQLNGAGSSSGANFSYQWVAGNGGAIDNGATTLTPMVSAPGVYTLTVLDAQNGCVSTDSVVITQDVEEPVVAIGTPGVLTCIAEEISLSAAGSDAGPGFQLTWSATGGGNIVNATNPLQPLIDAPGSYTLTILNLNNTCSAGMTVEVIEMTDPPGADAGPDLLLHCDQQALQLEGSSPIGAAGVYAWTTADGSLLGGANTPQPSAGAPGVYLLTVTDPANGCISEDQMTVTADFPVSLDYTLDPPVCLGYPGFIQFGDVLGGTPPYQYSISGGFTFSNQTFYGALAPGTYDLVVRDANGCELYEEAILAPGVDVQLDVEREVLLSLGESYAVQVFVNIDENDIETITWEPGLFLSCDDCLTPIVTPTHSIDYLVTVTTADGCEGEARLSFRVKKEANVYVPNVFSPNGDGENDIFMIFAGNQVAEVKNFEVFNRWGESVFQYTNFQPNDPAFGWDGKHRGQDANPAVFTWYAEIEMIDGRVELFEGSVALVR